MNINEEIYPDWLISVLGVTGCGATIITISFFILSTDLIHYFRINVNTSFDAKRCGHLMEKNRKYRSRLLTCITTPTPPIWPIRFRTNNFRSI